MLVHALTPPTQAQAAAVPRGSVTYGDLIEATCQAVKAAILLPDTQPLGPAAAHAELRGYQSFLRASGLHLGLLGRFQREPTREQRHLVGRLTSLPIQEPAPSNWARAAQCLGAAHDLLATHLDPRQQPRTAEAEELLTPAAVLAPTADVTALVLDAVRAGPDLVQSAVNAQSSLWPRPIPPPQLKALREWIASLAPFAKAAHLDASGFGADNPISALSHLEPAPLLRLEPTSRTAFDSELEALRTLRQLTFAQAHGELAASPMSLRDLALLGAQVTHPDLSWLPTPSTGLESLHRAQALDTLDAAHASWSRAAEHLTQSVLGTTRAPRLYADAIDHLNNTDGHNPSVRLALLTALPRLARDASAAVDHLQHMNALVVKRREPGLLTMVWRPLTPADAHELASRFGDAAATSEVAAVTVRRNLVPPSHQGRQSTDLSPPAAVRRELETSRTAQR